jgi:hypothetical protein
MLENSTILMVRHGEKPGKPCGKDTKGDYDLSEAGQERSQAYVNYFENYVAKTNDGSESQPIKIEYLFAAANTDSSHRPVETLTPLAQATSLPFNTDIADDSYKDVKKLLADQQYAGAGIVICWHHGMIVDFANDLLTVNHQQPPDLPTASTWPTTYDCNTFGWLFQIRYDDQGIVMPVWTRCLNEGLMSDDTIDPPGVGAAMQP